MGLTAERHAKTPPTREAPRRGSRQAHPAKVLERPEGESEDAWAVADAATDAQALVALSEFLAKRGLRGQGSACQDAMDAISRLQEEVRQLKAAPGRG
jgi:mannose-6-phosphate isomerase class I